MHREHVQLNCRSPILTETQDTFLISGNILQEQFTFSSINPAGLTLVYINIEIIQNLQLQREPQKSLCVIEHSYHQSLKYFVLLENSNLGSKLRRLSRFLRLRRKRRSRWRQDLIKIKRAEARIMTMRTSSGGPRVPRVTSP